MGRSQDRAIKYILLLSIIVMLSGCAQVVGALAGAAVQGIASGIVNSVTRSGDSKTAQVTAEKTQQEPKAATELSSQPPELVGPASGKGDQPAKESPVPYDIVAKLENKEIKFNKVIAALKTTESTNNNKVITKILDENEVNKITEILNKCGLYDELKGNSILNISFTVDGLR